MTLNYLSRNRVMDDHERFAENIKTQYNVFDCGVYENDTHFTYEEKQIPAKSIGYVIDKDGKQYIVSKLFVENQAGELSMLSCDFCIKTDGKVTHTQLFSLGDVFHALGIKKAVLN